MPPYPVQKPRRPRAPARPWPLLASDQDPTSREALVAYHLHRLKLVGKPLRDSGFCQGKLLPLLLQAGLELSAADTHRLAKGLRADVSELTRPLTDGEAAEWRYYRYVAAHPDKVWRAIQCLITRHGLTLTEVSNIMQVERGRVARNLRQAPRRGHHVLGFAPANRLCIALRLPGRTDALIAASTGAQQRPVGPSCKPETAL